MQIPTDSITISNRVRQELGDLTSLKESLKTVGQLNPIVITRQNELIAGHRRLTAARELGWQTVDAISVDRGTDADRLQMELEENVVRKDFSAEEIIAGYQRLEELRRPRLKGRLKRLFGHIADFFRNLFKRKPKPDRNEPVPAEPPSSSPSTAEEEPEPPLGV